MIRCKVQCCKQGLLQVSNYPDDPQLSRLTHSEECECVTRETR